MDFIGQLTPKRTLEILNQIGHTPCKKLGQNFLIDSNIVRKSIEFADVKEDEYVVEVGPGLGTLTGALLEKRAKVYAVELDKKLYGFLEKSFGAEKNLKLINDDAVDSPLASLPEDIKRFKIVANLPYAISTIWMDKILSNKLPEVMSLMLQKEAALRFIASGNTKEYAPISIFLNSAYDTLPIYKVSASCFFPRPKVDSVLLVLRLKDKPFIFNNITKNFVRKIFLKRRKQIGSIVKDFGDKRFLDWIEVCEGLAYASRPESISLENWQKLDEILSL